ncbi:MAG: hypothetical protein NT025_03815 [bacterium]|nr:hypothetical protein [bacterium]
MKSVLILYLAPMPPISPVTTRVVRGFPAALTELRQLPEGTEPDLVLGLFGLLRAAGMTITYVEAEVLSGHAAQFLYSREQPECAQLAFAPPAETLFRALDVTWKEVTPSGPSTAFDVLRGWIADERVALARLKEPMLIYGHRRTNLEQTLLVARLQTRLAEETMSLDDCDQHYWRYPLDDGNVLLAVMQAPRRIENLTELARVAARRAVRLWHTADLAGCASGDEAYGHLAADLADAAVDFDGETSGAWMGRPLWIQWTARMSSQVFFERAAPRFGGGERAALAKAAFCYGECANAWKRWALYLGPTWNHGSLGFPETLPEDFIRRWRSRDLRLKAVRRLEEARAWEEKAVTELTKVIR